MNGAHEDEVGSSFLRAVYRRGNIVRSGDVWGVVTEDSRDRYHPAPVISWLFDCGWSEPMRYVGAKEISAPYVHTYEGIPDEVLAKATELQLTA